MNPENIPYAAKVNAAAWLIRKARKIARRLTDATPEQRQAIESEIVEIGMRLYSETREEPQPEATHDPHARAKSRYEFGDESERDAYVADVVDQIAEATPEPGGDYQLGLYANAVVELDACVEMWFIENDYKHGFAPEQTVGRWRDHLSYSTGQDHELEAYIVAVRELVPGADRAVIQYWYDRRVPIQETAQKWLAFLAFTEQQRKGVNP